MEEITISCRYRSFVDHERSGMRHDFDTSFSSGYQSSASSSIPMAEGDTTRLKRELAAVRRQLTQMEDTISEHVEIRERIIKLSENEKMILKSQLQEARKTIEELLNEMEITRRAFTPADAKFSRQNGNAKMENNTIKNAYNQPSSMSPGFQENDATNQRSSSIKKIMNRFLSPLHPTIPNGGIMLVVIGIASILYSLFYPTSHVEEENCLVPINFLD